jgi:hypothetical protein
MASTSETGHAKNVANFEDLISFCTGYGTSYNPTKAAIKLPALNTLLTNSRNSLIAVNTALSPFNNTVNAREIAFVPLSKLVTRIINALDATDATTQVVKDAKTIARKLQGKRAEKLSPPPPPPPPAASIAPSPLPTPLPITPVHISASQMSFDSRIENFSKLITLLTNEPLYAPNETDLKLIALNTLLTSLKTTNTAVVNGTTPLSNARISRNSILYATGTGLVDIAGEVKKYVKSVFGGTSPQYKQVSGLKFTRPKQ